MKLSKAFKSLALLVGSIALTGCFMAPGADLTPNNQSELYHLVDINEATVLPEPVTRVNMADTLGGESDEMYQYRVGPHDVLNIRVWNHPELSTSMVISGAPAANSKEASGIDRGQVNSEGVEVQADGYFFYPFAGMVQASGRTVDAIRRELTGKLAKFVKEPQVSVRVQEFNSQKAQVLGEVENPGPLPITSKPTRVLTAFSLAGGLTEEADKSEAKLIRGGKARTIDMASLFDGDLTQNVILRDGDVLNIDNNRFRQIVIMGEVNKVAAMPYDQRGMSLNNALVAASGISQNYSNAKGVYILRNGKAGDKATIYRLDMTNATALLLAERFPLKARDIVYVDTAGVARWNRVINQILPSMSFISATTAF
ncbi:polysaccharide biosynthesis/export family protein [Endozoicomonas sp. SESOKO1]|uniref:polysaccharide biosynthesis/export family protein n=1 Tax=Endozoicomonas sp. SESOKO1 TaxID=2828742 RepID=UPI0021475FFD|nr:polysaccharide biosynthesis/export family protein [Endozoicomonas sp. SESOKO1]